ncbi:protein FAR1-RELATED SEQUENCE 5-like [Humulus lupulus]|uniref:protein FAR1-RELATED SEQUENCE 5-like n=1 Tax=Humulus lupulus TaxID=3486 RepID=UPI002B414504|nr:protein FAR1-RELATED SEQUENCE 5-like [Humulus lupulus]
MGLLKGWNAKREVDKFGKLEKKIPKPLTRVGCPERLRVNLDKSTNLWVVRDFEPEHNHNLALPHEIQFLRSNKKVTQAIGQPIMSMRRSGIRTCYIMNHLAQERGGQDYVPFQKRDLYNWIGRNGRPTEIEINSEGALGYLECLAKRDIEFYGIYSTDNNTRLANLFWCDGVSRQYYQTFGDVLAFDTTYKTNAYNKPLLMFVGVNHHFRTIMFGCALLCDESASTFVWVLQCFLNVMNNKHPKVVVTDGDKAMREAIIKVMPNTVHRLCGWRLSTNASANCTNPSFMQAFNHLMYHYFMDEQEWEDQWKSVIEGFQLEDNGWMKTQYKRKTNWAETFLRGNFVDGLRTTQRCESTNSYLNQFLTSNLWLSDFIGQIDAALQTLRHQEMQDDFRSNHTSPQLLNHV